MFKMPWSKSVVTLSYTVLNAEDGHVVVFYAFANGIEYQHTIYVDTSDGPATLAAIEAAGREYAVVFSESANTEETTAPEIESIIGVPVEIPEALPVTYTR